jgi:hypothetical protein
MKKTALFALALLAAPIVAMGTPEIAVHQTPTPATDITIPKRFVVVYVLPVQAVLESMSGPRVRVTVPIGIHTALALRAGEIVRLKIGGRP